MAAPLLSPDKSYTFSDIFALGVPADRVSEHFGYEFSVKKIDTVPPTDKAFAELDIVRQLMETALLHTLLDSEAIRREVLIAPLVVMVAKLANAFFRAEYPVSVTPHLQGRLDYLLMRKASPDDYLLIIEAKRQDTVYGMAQLAAELIALDQWDKTSNQATLTGAISTGEIWQFAVLHRAEQHIYQDISLYQAPRDLNVLASILLRALNRE